MASTSPVKLSQPIVSAHLPFLTHQPLPQADQEVFLDANSDEEDKGAGSAGPGPEASGLELNMHVTQLPRAEHACNSAAAVPLKVLLACVEQTPTYHAATVSIQLCPLAASACVLCSRSNILVLCVVAANGASSVFRSSLLAYFSYCTDLFAGAGRTYKCCVVLQCIQTCMHVSPSQ